MIHNVARILELVVPLMEHPSETFLASLEEDLMRLTVKHGQTVGTKILFVYYNSQKFPVTVNVHVKD